MVGVRGIPIFGDRSRKFCFFSNGRITGCSDRSLPKIWINYFVILQH